MAKKREKLKTEIEFQYKEAMRELSNIRTLNIGDAKDVSYDVSDIDGEGNTLGRYEYEKGNKITIDRADIKEVEHTLPHEQQHRNFAYKVITTSDGKVVQAQTAPMSLEQQYKLAQADEIGASIAELLSYRQKYVAAHEDKQTAKNDALFTLAGEACDPDMSKLMKAVENDVEIKKDGSTYTFQDGEKTISVTIPKESEINESVSTYIEHKEKFKEIDNTLKTQWVNDKDFGEYFQKIKEREINPLSTNPRDMSEEMEQIGNIVSSMWQKKYKDTYDAQCINNVASSFNRNYFDEMKKNDHNYNEALSKALTAGGWDFSNYVKDNLTCPEKITNIDKQIEEGKNMAEVENYARGVGITLTGRGKSSLYDRISAYIAKDYKNTDRKPTPLEDESVYKYKLTEKDKINYRKVLENLEKLPNEEPYTKFVKDIKALDFDNKTSEMTTEEVKKFRELWVNVYDKYKKIDEKDSVYEPMKNVHLGLTEIYRSYSNSKDRQGITEAEKEEYKRAYNAIKNEHDVPFEKISLRTIKELVNYEFKKESIKEEDVAKSYEKQRDEYRKTENSQKVVDFSKPFLQEYYNKLKEKEVSDAQQRIHDAINRRRTLAIEEQVPISDKIVAGNPNSLIYAARNQGRD